MWRVSWGEKLEWGFLIVFALVVGYFSYRGVSHAAGIWFGLLPVMLFFNDRVLGVLPPFPQRRTLQTVISLGYMAILYLLLQG